MEAHPGGTRSAAGIAGIKGASENPGQRRPKVAPDRALPAPLGLEGALWVGLALTLFSPGSCTQLSLRLFAQVLCLHFKQDDRCKRCPSFGLRSASGVLEGRAGPSPLCPHSVAHDRLPMEHDEIHKKWLCERTGSLET